MAAYGISYGIVDGKTLNKREVVPKFMEAEGFTIRKLKEGTQYWFKVQAIYEEFAGPWSEKVEGTTGKPQPPVNFKVDKNTKAAKWFVNVSWENNPLNDERKLNIEEYRVKCWDSNNPTDKYDKTFSVPTQVSTQGVLETTGKVNYVCSVQVKTDKGTLSEVKQSGVAFDDIEKPAVSKRSERWGIPITVRKVADHSYKLKQAITGVAFDENTGQITALQPAARIIIVAKRTGYEGSTDSDPIEFTRQAGSTLTFTNIDVPVEYGKSGNTHTQTASNDRAVAGDTGVVSYSISPTGVGASVDTASGKVVFTLAAIGKTFTITARKAESTKYEAQTASYQLRVRANTNTADITKPAVSKRSERWGTPIIVRKVADHSYKLKQAITGVAFDESTGEVTATQPAARIIIVATRTGYAGSVESDPIEFTKQAGSTLKFANIDVPVEYGKSGNSYTQTASNDRAVAGDTGVVSYSTSPTGAGTSVDTGSGKVVFTLAAIGKTFTITARKAESTKYEAQTASYQLRVQANTNTADITKPAVSKRSERWGTPITVRKVADHSYKLKQAITGVAFDENTGQVTATQAAARIIIVATRTGYAGSVESDPIEFIKQAGSTIRFANANKNIIYATGRNSYTQVATNDRSVSGDTRNIKYSISPTGAGASIDTVSGKVNFTPGAIGKTFTITARKAESARYEEQTASYQLTVAKFKPTNKAALQAEIRKAIRARGNNVNLNYIDTLDITDMSSLFEGMYKFNGDISRWNTSKVTNMSRMFFGETAFNQPLNSWNVSRVTNMSLMFTHATAFNQSLDNWDVSSVTNMSSMFSGATAFNKNLNSWKVSSVTDMSNMFRRATSFNQPLNTWKVSRVTNMRYMFYEATSFNQPLDNWDVSKVTNMELMFYNAKAFNRDISGWVSKSKRSITSMFNGTKMKKANKPRWAW